MSGGSYNYICYCDTSDFMSDYDKMQKLELMAERLESLPYANKASVRTRTLIKLLNRRRTECDAIIDELKDVFKAVEWWDSGDWNEKYVKEAVSKLK